MNNGKTSESGSGTLNDEQCAVCRNRLIGYIFQSFDPGIRYTVEKSIEIPLLIADAMKAERIIRRTSEAVENAGSACNFLKTMI